MDQTPTTGDNFEEDRPRPVEPAAGEALVLDIHGFEGPIDVLLVLARAQKVDLRQISILELVEQYLDFIAEARRLRLELAAEYLVMAAWLAYLKSRLLLPEEEHGDEPSAEELAARLQLQLQRLEAMRDAGARLLTRGRLGRDVFARGVPEGLKRAKRLVYDVTFYELLKAYGAYAVRGHHEPLHIEPRAIYALEQAIERLSRLLGVAVEWTQLEAFLPEQSGVPRRSKMASMFVAALEMTRAGRAEMAQEAPFRPLYLRARGRAGS